MIEFSSWAIEFSLWAIDVYLWMMDIYLLIIRRGGTDYTHGKIEAPMIVNTVHGGGLSKYADSLIYVSHYAHIHLLT